MNSNCLKRNNRWGECYAKLVLEQTFPKRFYQLEIVDKPDLQNSKAGVGIEVTTAIPSSKKESDHLFSKLEQKCGTSAQLARSRERIHQIADFYDDIGVMANWLTCRAPDALENKLKKLNGGGYKEFEKQFIFITADYLIKTEKQLNSIHAELKEKQKGFRFRFESVFLLLFGEQLIEFDMNSEEHNSVNISNYVSLTEEAMKIAEGKKTL